MDFSGTHVVSLNDYSAEEESVCYRLMHFCGLVIPDAVLGTLAFTPAPRPALGISLWHSCRIAGLHFRVAVVGEFVFSHGNFPMVDGSLGDHALHHC